MELESKASGAEFQAVVLAGGHSPLLHPLTESTPRALLPVAHRPLIDYQLSLLEKAGFSDVIIIAHESAADQLREHLESRRGRLLLDVVSVENDTETADALRLVGDKIKHDFMVINGDLVTESSVHHLADMHRTRDASVTMLMKAKPTGGKDARGRIKKIDIDDYIGLSEETGRVVFMECDEDNGGVVELDKSLLKRVPSVCVRGDLVDSEFYVFAHWVMDLLFEKPAISSIKADLIPHLVKRQFLAEDALPPEVRRKAETSLAAAHCMSSSSHVPDAGDLVRCFAYVLPADGPLCQRVTTVAEYMTVNQDVAMHPLTAYTPWAKLEAHRTFRDSVVGEGTDIGKKVTLKKCVVGPHCSIGDGAKLNNCVLMAHAVVEAGCVVQNSVLCSQATIGRGSRINDSQIGVKYIVAPGTTLKGAQVTVATFEDGL